VTDEEHDVLQIVYAEAHGLAEKWVALTELPVVATSRSCKTPPTFGMSL
jgi:hypothetical protein